MSSTQGFHMKSVFMSQGTTHLRVGSSAEFKVAAGAKFLMEYEKCTGKSGWISNSGISYILTTANSTLTLRAPVKGSVKYLLFGVANKTSNTVRVRTSAKGIKIGTTNCSVLCSSHAHKTKWGQYLNLVGYTTAKWIIFGMSSTDVAQMNVTSSTG